MRRAEVELREATDKEKFYSKECTHVMFFPPYCLRFDRGLKVICDGLKFSVIGTNTIEKYGKSCKVYLRGDR